VHLENVKPARPYEFLLSLMGRPLYREVDPTILMFIFFPLFFGFMVGDVIVGLAIAGVGLLVKKHKIFGIGGPAVSRILVLSGLIAVLFGFVVFGEGLGIHFVVDDAAAEEGELSWEVLLYGKENVLAGHGFPHEGFIHKTSHAAAHGEPAPDNGTMTILAEATEEHSSPFTIAPHGTTHLSFNGWFNLGYYSKIHDVVALLIWSLVIGVLHLVLGLFIGVRNIAVGHGIKLAVQERVSWLLLLASVGFIVWGLTGSTGWALPAGVGLAVASVVLLIMGMTHQLGNPFVATMVVILEVPSIFGNILSYARLAAIGASKAGMAIAFSAIGFLLSGGEVGIVWWIIYIFGMIVITGLAILSGGLQSLRLQFVEFFSKFYEGGGRPYVPFGRRAP
jgi:V/A-type H+/Na+-transporting ATPase subunit I